mmetsp:Transcript_19139/g.41566  ORF Transcript_19139/g.41566 Transcript_19139/m.41566 type:complete len:652 (-) Transcript_19139:639-2594(-)
MSEITLTGGTLVPSSPSSGSNDGPAHDNSNTNINAGSAPNKNGIEMTPMSANNRSSSLPMDIATATGQEIARILFTLMRFGRFESVPPIIEKMKENDRPVADVLKEYDEGGHTLFHWASKRVDDIRFLQTLVELVGNLSLKTDVLNAASKDNVGMRPIHWACTEGSIPHAALLLNQGANIEAEDNSGCTPLLIAAQYGRVEVVAYLLKKGANLQAVDSSRDTALHWAAYKGSNEVCGLLAYYQQLSFAAQDTYGQSPLHLAALRGNTSVVRYILQKMGSQRGDREVLFVKDKNGRTPLDLAIHKQKRNVEYVLKEAMAAAEDPRGHFLRKTLGNSLKDLFSIRSWQNWFGMLPQTDEMDAPSRFPFYIVLANLALHFLLMVGVMAPFGNAGKGLLWDKSGWLVLDFTLMVATWYTYAKTVRTSPGYLDESHPDIGKWRKLYEETLESLAENETNQQQRRPFQLSHTCHVAKPHRSKYCRVTRKCVLLFDHFCPFVDNTIGLYNYHYFYMFLASIMFGLMSFFVTLLIYISRYRAEHGSYPWLVMALGGEISCCLVPPTALFVYHTQLIYKNISTNEHINMFRYKYLFPVVAGRRVYKNPWDKGFIGNFMDRMNPSRTCYEIPADFESLINGDAPMPSSGCCNHGKCEHAHV